MPNVFTYIFSYLWHWFICPIPPTNLKWGALSGGYQHQCSFCGIILLTGERTCFCCGKDGIHLDEVPLLLPLPIQYSAFLNDPNILHLSHILNLIFSFASFESTPNLWFKGASNVANKVISNLHFWIWCKKTRSDMHLWIWYTYEYGAGEILTEYLVQMNHNYCNTNKENSIWLPGEPLSQLTPLTLHRHS